MHCKAWKCWYYKLKGVLYNFCCLLKFENLEKLIVCHLRTFFVTSIFFWTRVCLLYPHVYHALSATILHFWSRDTQKGIIYTMTSWSVVTYTLVFGCICSGSWRYALWEVTRFLGIPKYNGNTIFPLNRMHQRQKLRSY